MKKGDKIVFSVILIIIVLGFACTFLYKHFSSSSSTIAVIKQDGKILKRINLCSVNKNETFTLKTKNGHYNTIFIKKGSISILKADCPDKVCIKSGPISKPGDTLVCLPHKLIIAIEGASKNNKNNNVDATTY